MDFLFEVKIIQDVDYNQKTIEKVWLIEYYDKDDNGKWIHQHRLADFGVRTSQNILNANVVKDILKNFYIVKGETEMEKIMPEVHEKTPDTSTKFHNRKRMS